MNTVYLRYLLFFLIGFLLGQIIVAKADTFSLPTTTKTRLNDFADILTPTQKHTIETHLYKIQNGYSHKPEFVVVTVPNLEGTTIEEIAQNVFTKWRVGRKDLNNGLVLVIAKEGDRKIRIQTGYGLEPYITDIQTAHIIRNSQKYLSMNDYYSTIMSVILDKSIHDGFIKFGNDNKIEPVSKTNNNVSFLFLFVFWLIFLIITYLIFKSNRNRTISLNRTPAYVDARVRFPTSSQQYNHNPHNNRNNTSNSYERVSTPTKSETSNDTSSFTSGVIAGMVVDAVVNSIASSTTNESSSSWGNSDSSSSYDSYSSGGGDSGGGGSSD